ncbi:MAG: PD-(D/E)XK nuclease family protein [Dehalococcoidia bacterium]|jgi:hypothetical protein
MQLIQPHSSWNITDATKIQNYMDCPRSYFYEYILGWRPEAPNLHLEFGKAWHLAMEHLILCHGRDGCYTPLAVHEAYELFLTHYRQFWGPMQDEANHPKSPGSALKALAEYTIEYHADSFTPLYTEIAGTVPLAANKLLHFRMDSILQTGNMGEADSIRSREHKTASQLSRQWTDQWLLKTQSFIYNHVLCCLFPQDQVWGIEINGVIFNKTKIQFQRVPARQPVHMMEVGFWNVGAWFDAIQEDIAKLQICSPSENVMRCFRQNTESCTKYFGCRYHDFCMGWANPLQHLDEMPMGFKVEYWNPADEESKVVFDLPHIASV